MSLTVTASGTLGPSQLADFGGFARHALEWSLWCWSFGRRYEHSCHLSACWSSLCAEVWQCSFCVCRTKPPLHIAVLGESGVGAGVVCVGQRGSLLHQGMPLVCLADIQGRFLIVPRFQEFVHLVLICDASEKIFFSLLSLPRQAEAVQFDLLPHAFEEVEDAFVSKESAVLTAGFLKNLLLNVNVVAPVACLQEGGLVEARSEPAGKESCYDKDQQNAPAKCLCDKKEAVKQEQDRHKDRHKLFACISEAGSLRGWRGNVMNLDSCL